MNFDVLTTGSQNLIFQGQFLDQDRNIALGNITLKLITPINPFPSPTPSPSVNLLTNGTFTSPSLGVNTLSRMGQGGSITGRTYANVFQIALCNGILDSLGYRKTTTSQFVFMTGRQNISQTINITQTGTNYFSLDYCKPTTCPLKTFNAVDE